MPIDRSRKPGDPTGATGYPSTYSLPFTCLPWYEPVQDLHPVPQTYGARGPDITVPMTVLADPDSAVIGVHMQRFSRTIAPQLNQNVRHAVLQTVAVPNSLPRLVPTFVREISMDANAFTQWPKTLGAGPTDGLAADLPSAAFGLSTEIPGTAKFGCTVCTASRAGPKRICTIRVLETLPLELVVEIRKVSGSSAEMKPLALHKVIAHPVDIRSATCCEFQDADGFSVFIAWLDANGSIYACRTTPSFSVTAPLLLVPPPKTGLLRVQVNASWSAGHLLVTWLEDFEGRGRVACGLLRPPSKQGALLNPIHIENFFPTAQTVLRARSHGSCLASVDIGLTRRLVVVVALAGAPADPNTSDSYPESPVTVGCRTWEVQPYVIAAPANGTGSSSFAFKYVSLNATPANVKVVPEPSASELAEGSHLQDLDAFLVRPTMADVLWDWQEATTAAQMWNPGLVASGWMGTTVQTSIPAPTWPNGLRELHWGKSSMADVTSFPPIVTEADPLCRKVKGKECPPEDKSSWYKDPLGAWRQTLRRRSEICIALSPPDEDGQVRARVAWRESIRDSMFVVNFKKGNQRELQIFSDSFHRVGYLTVGMLGSNGASIGWQLDAPDTLSEVPLPFTDVVAMANYGPVPGNVHFAQPVDSTTDRNILWIATSYPSWFLCEPASRRNPVGAPFTSIQALDTNCARYLCFDSHSDRFVLASECTPIAPEAYAQRARQHTSSFGFRVRAVLDGVLLFGLYKTRMASFSATSFIATINYYGAPYGAEIVKATHIIIASLIQALINSGSFVWCKPPSGQYFSEDVRYRTHARNRAILDNVLTWAAPKWVPLLVPTMVQHGLQLPPVHSLALASFFEQLHLEFLAESALPFRVLDARFLESRGLTDLASQAAPFCCPEPRLWGLP